MKTEPKYKIGDIVMFQAMPDATKENIGNYYSSNIKLNLHTGQIRDIETRLYTSFYEIRRLNSNRSYQALEKDIIKVIK